MTTPALIFDDFDPAVRAQDDLFRHVTGGWLARVAIPDDRARYGAFETLREAAEHAVRQIVAECAPTDDPCDPATQIAHLYAAFMDEDRIEALGAAPLADVFARIDAIGSTEDLSAYLGWAARHGLESLVGMGAEADPGEPTRYAWFVVQSGLGLPDEQHYRLEQHTGIRTAYRTHVERSLALAGIADADRQADAVLALETAIAACHWDRVRLRDMNQMYCPQTWEEFTSDAPGLDWEALREAAGIPALPGVMNAQRTFPAGAAALVASEPLASWRAWARWHALRALSPYLSRPFVEANFDFYGRTLSGTPLLRDRWKRGVAFVESALGEAVGRLYVARHFPPGTKAQADALVADLLEAYRRAIAGLDWMSEPTKREALAKLAALKPMIGYPTVWRDYSGLVVRPDDLVGDVLAAAAFDFDWGLSKLAGPLDREEWLMTPQMVNAYYHPLRNVIVFPAAILQPPFFNPDADAAVNYGGIGSVIGHEIGHGFDDQGSATDAAGRVRDWWTPADRAAFEARVSRLVGQYDALRPTEAPDVHVNGALTLGENIGDLGGLVIAYRAWQIHREGTTPDDSPVDGYTPTQRLFLSWAAVHQSAARPEWIRERIATDPHSPDEHRCNQTARNVTAFHDAFGTAPGDGMWLDPADRVTIW